MKQFQVKPATDTRVQLDPHEKVVPAASEHERSDAYRNEPDSLRSSGWVGKRWALIQHAVARTNPYLPDQFFENARFKQVCGDQEAAPMGHDHGRAQESGNVQEKGHLGPVRPHRQESSNHNGHDKARDPVDLVGQNMSRRSPCTLDDSSGDDDVPHGSSRTQEQAQESLKGDPSKQHGHVRAFELFDQGDECV